MCISLYIYPLWTSESLKSGLKDVLLAVVIIYRPLKELRFTGNDEELCISTASRPAVALKDYGDTLSGS